MVILYSVLSFIHDISSAICFVIVMSQVFNYRERNRKITLSAFCLGGIFSAINSVFLYLSNGAASAISELMDNVTIIIPFAVTLAVLNIKKIVKPIVSMLMIMLSVETVYGLVAFLFNAQPDTVFDNILDRGLSAFGYTVIILILILFGKKSDLSLIKNTFLSVPKWLFSVWFILTLSVYFMSYSGRDKETDTHFAAQVLISVSAVCIFVCIIYFVYKIFSLSLQQTQILKQLDEQHSNYENMLTGDQELRQFRHDYKNHIIAVTAFLNAGKTEEAAEYLEVIKVQSGVQKRKFSTGSFVADAVLNNKISLAEELEIKMSFNGVIPENAIAHSDICTILGNLIDNAIEALKTYTGEKYINIETYSRESFFIISVTNPVNKPVEIKNNRIRTTKSDTKNHGIGLRNIERIAEKYDGRLRLSCDSKEFTADIYLKLIDNKEAQ